MNGCSFESCDKLPDRYLALEGDERHFGLSNQLLMEGPSPSPFRHMDIALP